MDGTSSYGYGISGVEYERYCGRFLSQKGFRDIRYTPVSDDYGADIVAKDSSGQTWVFQCKYYSGSVGKDAVQEVTAAKAHYKASYAAVITNSHLTSGARILANENNVKLYENVVPSNSYQQASIPEVDYEYPQVNGESNAKLVLSIIAGIVVLSFLIGGAISYRIKGPSRPREKEYVKTNNYTAIASETRGKETETTETTASEILYNVIVNTGRIRKGPGTDTDTITLVHLNDELKGSGKTETIGNTIWYEVYYDDTDNLGWASEIVVAPVEGKVSNP